MKTESIVRLFAGSVILVSLALAHFHSPYWLWLTGWVGFMLAQSSLTGFCPACMMINKVLGRAPGC